MVKKDQLIDDMKLRKNIQSIMEKYKVIGFQAVSVYKDDIIWSTALGYRNIKTMDPVTERTMFRIASITKLFTSTAILKLVEQELVNLDEDISKYLGFQVRNPNFPDSKITIKHLLTHTSSLTSDENSNSIYAKFIKEGNSDLTLNLSELLTIGGKYFTYKIWGNWKPGSPTKWVYSNIAAIICGAIIEKVSGQRFDLFIKNNVFIPLKMKNVAFSYAGMKSEHELANLYEIDTRTNVFNMTIEDAEHKVLNFNTLNEYVTGTHGGLFEPQGGLRTTAIELSKFLRALMLNGNSTQFKLLNEETSKLMKSVHWSREKVNHFFSKMGLGIHISHDFLVNYEEMHGHAGEAFGLLSNLYWNEEKQFGIIFIMNGCEFSLENQTRFEVEKEFAEVIYQNTVQNIIQ